MKKSRTRTLVTIVGVVLSAAMITAVATFCVSLLNYMANGAAQNYGGWHVKFEDVDSSFAAKQVATKLQTPQHSKTSVTQSLTAA